MAVALPSPPAGYTEGLAAWVRRLCEQVGEEPRAQAPVPVYTVGRDDLAAGRLLDVARLRLWRSALVDAAGTLRALELAPPAEADAPWELGGLFTGAEVEALQRALQAAVEEALPGEELRILRSAAPRFEAAWLHGAHGDRLVPAADRAPDLEACGVYDAEPVRVLLELEARAMAAQPEDPELP